MIGADVLRVVVVDDEPHARAGLGAYLARRPDVTLVGEAGDGSTAISVIRNLAPDLVLLDIQMPGADGFSVLREIGPDCMPAVIFVTAFDHYAVAAFDARALDYVLKPVDPRRLDAAIERARTGRTRARDGELRARLRGLLAEIQELSGIPPSPGDAGGGRGIRLSVRTTRGVHLLESDEVAWIEGASYRSRIHVGRQSLVVRETLQSFVRRLDPSRFVRVHRSAIVNVSHVLEVSRGSSGEPIVVLRDGTRVRVSRSYREGLASILSA